MEKVTWNTAKTKKHDASGVSMPEKFMWEEKSGVYYPAEFIAQAHYNTLEGVEDLENKLENTPGDIDRDLLLTDWFKRYCERYELPLMSADELLLDIKNDVIKRPDDKHIVIEELTKYGELWDKYFDKPLETESLDLSDRLIIKTAIEKGILNTQSEEDLSGKFFSQPGFYIGIDKKDSKLYTGKPVTQESYDKFMSGENKDEILLTLVIFKISRVWDSNIDDDMDIHIECVNPIFDGPGSFELVNIINDKKRCNIFVDKNINENGSSFDVNGLNINKKEITSLDDYFEYGSIIMIKEELNMISNKPENYDETTGDIPRFLVDTAGPFSLNSIIEHNEDIPLTKEEIDLLISLPIGESVHIGMVDIKNVGDVTSKLDFSDHEEPHTIPSESDDNSIVKKSSEMSEIQRHIFNELRHKEIQDVLFIFRNSDIETIIDAIRETTTMFEEQFLNNYEWNEELKTWQNK